MESRLRKSILKSRNRLIDLSAPIVMGIINLTSDSFYSDSRVEHDDLLLSTLERMVKDGADIIDLGAMSSRPGAQLIDESEESDRLCRAVELVKQHFPSVLLSADSWRVNVSRQVMDAGADIINDISGGLKDESIYGLCSQNQIPYICMHMRGEPSDMQAHTDYENVVVELLDFFAQRCRVMEESNLFDYILDPGIGFAKTLKQNYTILSDLQSFRLFHAPILVGLSRKSMIYKFLGTDPQHALNGTTALHMYALERGASILRAHDVKEAVETRDLFVELSESSI